MEPKKYNCNHWFPICINAFRTYLVFTNLSSFQIQVDVTGEEWAKMDFVYRKAERQTRMISKLQEDFESGEGYLSINGASGDSDGVGIKATRHINRNLAYTPQGI